MTTADGTPTITLRSGLLVDPFSLFPHQILIEDIAHSLAAECRFGGHCWPWYSVGEHCVRVARMLLLFAPQFALDGLMHDASECYLKDLPRPVKRRPELEFYRRAERHVQGQIRARFGLRDEEPEQVTFADDAMLAIEFRDLMPGPLPAHMAELIGKIPHASRERIVPMSPTEAKAAFLNMYATLSVGGP